MDTEIHSNSDRLKVSAKQLESVTTKYDQGLCVTSVYAPLEDQSVRDWMTEWVMSERWNIVFYMPNDAAA